MNRLRPFTLHCCGVVLAAVSAGDDTEGAIFDSASNRVVGQKILAATPQLQSTGFIKSLVSEDRASAVLIAPNAILTAAHADIRNSILENLRFGMGTNYDSDTGPLVKIREVFHLSPAPIDFATEPDFTLAILEETFAGPGGVVPDAEIADLSQRNIREDDEVAVVGYGSLDPEFELRDGARDLYSDIVVTSPFFLLAGEYFTTRVLDSHRPANGIPVGQGALGSSGGGTYWNNGGVWELVGVTSGTSGSTTHYAEITPATQAWIKGILAANPPEAPAPLRIDSIATDGQGDVVIRFPTSPGYEYDLLRSEDLVEWKVAATGAFTDPEGVFFWRKSAISSFFKIARRRP